MIFELSPIEGLLLRRALNRYIKYRQSGIEKLRTKELDTNGLAFLTQLLNEQEIRQELLVRLKEEFPEADE